MALPVYAEVDPLPDAPDEVELLEDEQGTASGEDTVPPEQNAATPVPDAATPEPEQSAEPEQPAPTETLEPTAEPTPTPEPAATATAPPVPTVTPTATPEPTEQPQKMYAAKSVDNVQAVSEPEAAEGFTVYFVVPNTMPNDKNQDVTVLDSDEIRFNVNTNAYPTGDCWQSHTMEPTGWETNGHKIYAVKNCKDIKGEKFKEIQFQLYRNGTWTAQITLKQSEPKPINSYNNKMYDPTKNADPTKGEWTDDSILTSHTYYAGKPIKFENRSTANLTNVKANFYIPDEKSETLTLVNDGSEAKPVAKEEFVTFTIPDVECSYVQFTWVEDGKNKTSKYYNFYNESVSGNDKESFMYSETRNCFIYTGADNERWGIENSFRIYYDATFSKMALNGDTDNYSIPKANNQETIYYRIKGDSVPSVGGKLVKDDTNENLYYVDIPQEYSSNSSIIFSGEEIGDDNATKGNGVSTEWLTIPTDDKNCFYADTNDDAVYKGTTRGGYWAPKGTLRDAETWKNTDTTDTTKTKVVDIASAPFTEEANTKYVTSTLYDYYTDYELNGKNRDGYGSCTGASHRNWVTFREFDQALSDYYQVAGAQYPIYTGHFQPADGPEFRQIADTLNLFGYDNENNKFNHFMAINNSQRNDDYTNGSDHINYAYQGLVADTTSNGNADGALLLNGTTTPTVEPHFNKEFLLGENSKNAKLGEVYENVKFPFTKKENLFNDDTGVDYWYFDSKDTTLYLKQDSGQNSDSKYFLQSTNNRGSSENVNASSDKQGQYGYFPFNETATGGVASTYNYGFGTKLQMDFTLTDDGMVETNKIGEDNKKVKTNIKFFFSGDDDVWVFIDGKLALDVGGAHGKVSGLLEFGETKDGKNSVTAYVSKVKKGGTAKDNDIDEKTVNSAVKTVKYNGNDIYFYAKNTNLEPLDKGKKHTLTMYYMERGMWESNMAVAFNFPDNNELQVQKEVDLNKVDPDFKKCFEDQKIFNFTIQNQATHYGEKVAVGSDTSIPPQEVKLTADSIEIKPATQSTEGDYIFKLDTNPEQGSGQDTEQVLHWYARYTDTEPVSAAREKRYGILTLKDPINIKDKRFLTFQVYVAKEDGGGDLSLNNLYLELLDDQTPTPVQKGSLGTSGINGATYGSVELKTDQWVTVKLDLHKMKEQGGSDGKFSGNVTTIRVGDNYSRNIYFRNFTFIPKAKPSTMSGFTTKQQDIPDYGSVKSGQLQNAENAQYTSNMDNDTQLVEGDGSFVLEAGEIVTFSDQFRRGSYISLKEDLNPNLYDTKWTVYENGRAVESTNPKDASNIKTVTFGNDRSLKEQNDPPKGPDDGRTENKGTGEEQPEENKYDGKKPSATDRDANTIVFRSYKNPDEKSSTLTKLKVKYVNTVKTGGLTIQKKAADDEENSIKGTYTFKVTFDNVGGEGLEDGDIIREYTIDMNDPNNPNHIYTITGIPVGTRYTIEEVKPKDDSRLQSVTVTGGKNNAHVFNNNTMVEGKIVESADPNNPEVTATFTNTRRKLINIEFNKLWEGTDNLSTANRPDTIYIQLQRRLATSKNDAEWKAVKYPADSTKDYVIIEYGESRWQYTFSGLDQYQINTDNRHTDYVYRIVEGTVENDKFKQVAPGGTITIKGNTYVVTPEATPNSETDSAGSSTGNTATANSETNSENGATTTPATATGGTITGGSGKIVLTNKLQNPKFVLDIIKKDAEPNNEGKEVPLSGVEFKLEKLVETTTEGKTQWVVDKNYKFDSTKTDSITGTTGTDGKITQNPFKNLEPGTYRLTETKAHPGYNLLAQPIVIKFTQDGKCYIDGEEVKKEDKTFNKGPNNTYTMTLTVLNRKTPELPHTGADAPSLWLLIGMPLAVAGLLIFTFRYNRKGGRRH